MNMTVVTLRGAKWPIFCLLIALLTMGVRSTVDDTSWAPATAAPLSWAFYGALAMAAVTYGYFMLRIFSWYRGRTGACSRCSGPTGWLESGRVYYGRQLPDFRRCYSCGQANAED